MKESRVRGLLSIPIQGFNRLVWSCPIIFIYSCGLRHGTRLQVLSVDFETMYS